MEKRDRKQTDRYSPSNEEKDYGTGRKKKKQEKGELSIFILSKCIKLDSGNFICNYCNKKAGSNITKWCQHIVLHCNGVDEGERLEVATKSNDKEIKLWLKETDERINEVGITNTR